MKKPAYDKLIKEDVILTYGNDNKHRSKGKIIGRSKDNTGEILDTYTENPLLNTLSYDVDFSDVFIKRYSSNFPAGNTLNQIDPDDEYTMLEGIVDIKKDDAVATPNSSAYLTINKEQK